MSSTYPANTAPGVYPDPNEVSANSLPRFTWQYGDSDRFHTRTGLVTVGGTMRDIAGPEESVCTTRSEDSEPMVSPTRSTPAPRLAPADRLAANLLRSIADYIEENQ